MVWKSDDSDKAVAGERLSWDDDVGGEMPTSDSRRTRPSFLEQQRELHFRGVLLKQFLQLARNQELVLLAFQAQRWRERIDDPLPLIRGTNAKQRLRDTCKNLNRCQREPLLHFFTDGARHVGWRPR